MAIGDGASSGQASHQLEGMDFSGPLPCTQLHSPFILPFLSGTTPNLGKRRSNSAFQEERVLQALGLEVREQLKGRKRRMRGRGQTPAWRWL